MRDRPEEKSWGLKRWGWSLQPLPCSLYSSRTQRIRSQKSLQCFYKIKINLLNLLCNS